MKKRILLLSCLVCVFQVAAAQLTARIIKEGLFIPWELVYGPDDHVWFTQKNGYICRINPVTSKTDTLYHETNTVIQNEGGMLGMALHPDFTNQPYVYVAYNYSQGGYKERIVRYTYAGGVLQNPQTLLDNINASSIHNGCRLLIVGDKLFITSGDASTTSYAQNISSLNGKTLRINLDGTIPSDNPIPGSPVWSWGHRNAQGMVNVNGKIFQSEHGPNDNDEINIIEKGRNYGWPTVRGYCDLPGETAFCNDSNVAEPVMAWTPTLAVCGIDYYTQPMFPSFQQSILMTTLKDQKLRQLKLNNNLDSVVSSAIIVDSFGRLRAICISPGGRIYIATSNSSAIGTGAKIDKIIELYDPSFIPVGINSTSSNIIIYPNPVGEKIYINLKGQPMKPYRYTLTGGNGQVVAAGNINSTSQTIDIKSLVPAIYYIQIFDNKTLLLKEKILKQ